MPPLPRTPWRAVEPADHAAVVALMLALFDEDPAPTPMTAAQAHATLRRLAAEPLRGRAIAYDDGGGAIGGYALLCAFWSNELGGEVCVVDELYVAPAHRGRGAASALIEALVAGRLPWFADAVAFELEVTPGNARARALYERLGFRAYKNALMRCAPREGAS